MEEFTGYPVADLREGRIIVAVTIVRPDGSADSALAPGADPAGWSVEGPHDIFRDSPAGGLHEVVRRALLRAGHPRESGDHGNSVAWPRSEWEQLVEVRLGARPHDLYAQALTAMERQLLTRVLDHTAGNQTRAAGILGITRGCLRAKIRTLGITIGHSVRSENDQLERGAIRDDSEDEPSGSSRAHPAPPESPATSC